MENEMENFDNQSSSFFFTIDNTRTIEGKKNHI